MSPDADHWQLRLYVVGQTSKGRRALTNITAICDEHLPGRYDIEVVDLADDPARAGSDDIFAVPTLVRHSPAPVARIIGDLSDTPRVLSGLELD